MLKDAFIATVLLLIGSIFDQHFLHGKYTDAASGILRQMRHSFRKPPQLATFLEATEKGADA